MMPLETVRHWRRGLRLLAAIDGDRSYPLPNAGRAAAWRSRVRPLTPS